MVPSRHRATAALGLFVLACSSPSSDSSIPTTPGPSAAIGAPPGHDAPRAEGPAGAHAAPVFGGSPGAAGARARVACGPTSWLELTQPVDGERLARESVEHISWSAEGAPPDATVVLEESTDGGASYRPIAEVAASAGSFLWTLPNDGPDGRRYALSGAWCGEARSTATVSLRPSERVEYAWREMTQDTGIPQRDGAGALVYDGKMWLIGGWWPHTNFPRYCGNDVWSSTDGVHWTMVKPQTFGTPAFDPASDWAGRHTGGVAVHHGRMWIVGGDPLQGDYQGDVWSSTDGKSWRRETERAPWYARALHYTVTFRDQLWVIGGQTMPDFVETNINPLPYTIFGDVWRSGDGAKWSEVPRAAASPPWPPRAAIMGSAVKDGRIWIMGGGTYDSVNAGVLDRTYMDDVWSSPDGENFERVALHAPWESRQYQSVTVWDDRLWVIAGYHERDLNGAWYSKDGRSWYPTETVWGMKHAASVWVYDDAVWISGGGDYDMWKLERVGGSSSSSSGGSSSSSSGGSSSGDTGSGSSGSAQP